ncbi:MAG: hypothetical protein U1G07_08585 [Verrucomicrobiota bacterium]
MNTPGLVLVVILLSLTACSKKEAAAAKRTNEGVSSSPLTAPVDYLGAVAKAKRISEKTIDSASLNQAIQLFYAQEDRWPRDLNELVSSHYIAAIPSPPAGARWAYNPQNGQIKAVRQP